MPYTLGANSTDRITITQSQNMFSAGHGTLIAGWFYPTTLTSGNVLWAAGTIQTRLQIDTTTSQLRSFTGQATTSAVATYSGDPIVTNEWVFIAWYANRGATSETPVVWQATATNPPKAMTRAVVTAGSGNVQSATSIVIGNQSVSPANAWQGDIANIAIIFQTLTNIGYPLEGTSLGGQSTSDIDVIFRRIVQPLWRGRLSNVAVLSSPRPTTSTNTIAMSASFDNDVVRANRQGVNPAPRTFSLTVTGATRSQNRSPSTLSENWPNIYPLRRR